MDRRAFLAATFSLSLSGCLEYLDGDGESITDPGDVTIVWSDLVRDDPGTEAERVAVWGAARNVGDRTLNYVEIRATFFDAAGEELESVIENVDADVSAGGEWPFEIEFPRFGERAAAVDAYELEPVTGV
ncbi:FxLYD domain-containing protein [Halopiger djelfimassiliensis]|uniref:FxLYD domain-containing protein n=1 Tax=Halopiger djelfimassiliensis TaxID=1293047 RepID=UPI0006775CC1|nr:FxLYD domain-containing protein [Halopiger djelfimassiliensis]